MDGAEAERGRLLNQPFRKHARTGRPLVVLKLAMTLDGRVATAGGDSQWISGEESRELVHRWRAESDAVASGIGTALADDPLLTAREAGTLRQPTRVVFDSEARLPLDSRLVETIVEAPLVVVASPAAPERAHRRRCGTRAPRSIVAAWGTRATGRGRAPRSSGSRDITSLLLEGGPTLAGAFLDAGRDRRAPAVHRPDRGRRDAGAGP